MRKNGGVTECVRFVTHTCLIQKCPNDLLYNFGTVFQTRGAAPEFEATVRVGAVRVLCKGYDQPWLGPRGRFLKNYF